MDIHHSSDTWQVLSNWLKPTCLGRTLSLRVLRLLELRLLHSPVVPSTLLRALGRPRHLAHALAQLVHLRARTQRAIST